MSSTRALGVLLIVSAFSCSSHRVQAPGAIGQSPSPPSLVGTVSKASVSQLVVTPLDTQAASRVIRITAETTIFASDGSFWLKENSMIGLTARVWFTAASAKDSQHPPIAQFIEIQRPGRK